MPQTGGPLVLGSVSHQGLAKHFDPHRPTSSAESSDSPTGLFANGCRSFTQSFSMHVDPAAALIAATPAADPVQAIRQGLSQLAPAQLAELQAALRQQRLERQQQDFLAVLSGFPSTAPSMASTLQPAACSTVDAAASCKPVPPSTAVPAPASVSCLPQRDAAQPAFLQSAAAHLMQQLFRHEELNTALQVRTALAPLANPAAEMQQLGCQKQQQESQESWQQHHPGVAASRSARNTWRSRGNWQAALALLSGQQQQQVGPSTDMHSGSCSATHTRRFSPEVTAALWQQLQQFEQEEQAQKASAAAQTAQRRSSRARKGKRDLDTTNNGSTDSRSSPDPAVALAVAAAAAAAFDAAAAGAARAGSADSTDANNTSTSTLLHHAESDASKQRQQKRVRFAIVEDLDAQQDEQTEADNEMRRKVVRRIGVRAQARKRMHKRAARRRRPMRAPLN